MKLRGQLISCWFKGSECWSAVILMTCSVKWSNSKHCRMQNSWKQTKLKVDNLWVVSQTWKQNILLNSLRVKYIKYFLIDIHAWHDHEKICYPSYYASHRLIISWNPIICNNWSILIFITDRVLAMSFPSEGFMSIYRNPIEEVSRFFNTKYPNKYRIYNCCSKSTWYCVLW